MYGYNPYWYSDWSRYDWEEFMEDHEDPNDEEDIDLENEEN